MAPHRPDVASRFRLLSGLLGHPLADELDAADPAADPAAELARLRARLPEADRARFDLAHAVAEAADDHLPLVRAVLAAPGVTTLRDVALKFNVDELAKLADPKELPAIHGVDGADTEAGRQGFGVAVRRKLFAAEPTAVLHRMVQDAEVPIADPAVRAGVTTFLANRPDFSLRTTSVLTALKAPDALEGIPDEHRPAVVHQLKALQRVQAISPVPEAVPALMKAGLTSAFRVGEMSEAAFVRAFAPELGADAARAVHTAAVDVRIRNEHALAAIRETARGTGLALIDGGEPVAARVARLQAVADRNAVPLNLSALFGNIDYCECDDCLSVYSPAAYFVELLQYLRNNDLAAPSPDPTKIDLGSPLDKLFRRRPDLGCLELTCPNTFTVLPYIDLVNEVMESFVVHREAYAADPDDPKHATLEAFNVADETSGELLAQPQHVNYQAYCVLKNAVYPFTLPYHQPIDAIRIFLDYLGTSRRELLDTFRSPPEPVTDPALTPALVDELSALHTVALDRAVDAETLGLTEEEYVILTRELFRPKRYYEIVQQAALTDAAYQTLAKVRPVHEYYGYGSEADMLAGLPLVKKEFLPRTGLKYTELVELLKTRFVNPNYPRGEALTLLLAVRFSYRFLQTLVDATSTDPKVRFAKLVAFLEAADAALPLLEARFGADPCKPKPDGCADCHDFRRWVYCDFEKIGKLIVLESGEGPRLGIAGAVFLVTDTAGTRVFGEERGTLRADGAIVKGDTVIGRVRPDGFVAREDGKPFWDGTNPPGMRIEIHDPAGKAIGYILQNSVLVGLNRETPVRWLPAQDTCDLDKVRLVHLDGTPVVVEEYDRIQRFIRLWRKLGWTADEVDQALVGLSPPTPAGDTADATDCADCGTADGEFHCDNSAARVPKAITPEFLHRLAAVRRLLDRTGLELPKLLTLWGDIGTAGENPLYRRLFLTHNLLALDPVFRPDGDGNMLGAATKLSDHLPAVQAALSLKAADVAAVVAAVPLADELTLAGASAIYRRGLLAKAMGVKVAELLTLAARFGDPFATPDATLALLDAWGRAEDAGFTFKQLDFLLEPTDPASPLAPAPKAVLQLGKALYDGLTAIDREHPDVTGDAPAELVRVKLGLVFDPAALEQVVGLLDGTTIYSTNAPVGLTIAPVDPIPGTSEKETLLARLRYTERPDDTPPAAALQVAGVLTPAEATRAKALSANPKWAEALDRVALQRFNIFNDYLAAYFPAPADDAAARAALLAGDTADTAPGKRLFLLAAFMPALRRVLARRLIIETLAEKAGLGRDVTEVLLADALTAGPDGKPALEVLTAIHDRPAAGGPGWTGYLIPPADGLYSFTAIGDTQPPPLTLDGRVIPFTEQQQDPTNVWSTDPAKPVKLLAGRPYPLAVSDRPAAAVQWRTAAAPKAPIPAAALLPDYTTQGTGEVLTKLLRAAVAATGFALSAAEVRFWQQPPALDFNAVTPAFWLRLQSYAALRAALGGAPALLGLFSWAAKPDDPAELAAKIAAATGWAEGAVGKLIAPAHFDLNRPGEFRDETNLVRLRDALAVADRIGLDIGRLFEWAVPTSKFGACRTIADGIRAAARARFSATDWEQVVKPLNDRLRKNQRDALVAYLLVQPALIEWGVVDADSLFEFFLIDVQMDCCLETSRIKQAISSVQSFVQRCMMGLEEGRGVPNEALGRGRWEWMQQYRVWEANRKVFLYPENWIEPTLRDDKSAIYKEFESELLQKDLTPQAIADALKGYLFKLDEVANLKVVGLVQDAAGGKLHVFSRTRTAPFFFYHRYFDTKENNWYPWDKVAVDVPNFDVENPQGHVLENGSYLLPAVWNGRLLVFFPQVARKAEPNMGDKVSATGGSIEVSRPKEVWEIRLGSSELRNGKWTPKQLAHEAVVTPVAFPAPNGGSAISMFKFVTAPTTAPTPGVVTDVYRDADGDGDGKRIGAFFFGGNQLTRLKVAEETLQASRTDFHYTSAAGLDTPRIHSYTAGVTTSAEPYFVDLTTAVTAHHDGAVQPFSHPFAHDLLGRATAGTPDDVFRYYRDAVADKADAFGADGKSYHELKRAYSLYNWEFAFHAPMAVTDRLLKAGQYEEALRVCRWVLDPLAAGTDAKRFWQFAPFKGVNAENVLEALFLNLKPNTPNAAIAEWRDKPFRPHVVARGRPAAYMKWVAMKYIEILIAYGDYYFRQNTLEMIPMAIQCYVLAAHLYGPRGQKIPKRGTVRPHTYKSLLAKWDAFGNAMVELELALPFSNQTDQLLGQSNGVVGLANVFGFATTLYFCIPDNPKLRQLRDTIDDRLFKIRHCQDIDGVERKLPLFEPPIDPALLVAATAAGVSLASVLNDLNGPAPNYRFYPLLQKAQELCAELKALGGAFLAAKEKKDAEALAKLRARHESDIHTRVMETRKKQLDEATAARAALAESRRGPEERMKHFLKLVGEGEDKVPKADAAFAPLSYAIDRPVDDGGLKLSPHEKEEMDKASAADDWQVGIGAVETLASVFHALPTTHVDGHPVGVGVDVVWGFPNLAHATSAVGRGLKIYADHLSYQSANSGRKAGFQRQLQDRVQQANAAGLELKHIDAQLAAQDVRIAIANGEIANQQAQIDNAAEVEEFLRNKYSSEELYGWLEGGLRAVYHQTYTLAYDLAKRAEKVFRFERGPAAPTFIRPGYWENGYDGLLAGERLHLALKQLEAAYQEARGYDFEITKHVSLRQLDPLALLQLRATGRCEFALPEVLFDMDYPGHYLRRIKSVALSVPCVVGPYTSLNCTLRLLGHKFRVSAIASGKADYPEGTGATDERFGTGNVPVAAVAVGSGQNDSGVFELNFRDERYVPFEGAGAISRWAVELPGTFRQFDYDTIADVVLHLRYTAADGGDKLKKPAQDSVGEFIKSAEELGRTEGLFSLTDVKNEYPAEWYKLFQAVGAGERVLPLGDLRDRLPVFAQGRPANKVLARNVYLFWTSVAA